MGRMKFSYAIDADRRLIFQRYEGQLTLARLVSCLERLWADPAYRPTYDGLVDISAVTPQASFQDLQSFIEFVRQRPEHSRGRWAAVASSPFMTACSMLYQKALASHHAFAVFSSTEAAYSFLHIEHSPPPAEMQIWNAP